MGLNSCLIFLGDAAVFLQISFGASEARECYGFSAREIGFVFFQRTATRYLPFSYLRKSFTLPKASLSSSVNTSLPSRSVPDFSITQNLFQLLSRSQQDSFPSLQISSLVDKERIT